MKLGLMLAQLMAAGCSYRIFKKLEDYEDAWGLESNRGYRNKSLAELMEIEVIKFEISADFPENIVYDIFI